MLQPPINHSPDLAKLMEDGYEIEIKANYLVVHGVPYVNIKREIRRGMIVSELTLAGDKTTKPNNHVVMFVGDCPCDKDGLVLANIINSSKRQDLGEGLIINHTFSSKPKSGCYEDYYEKITTYVAIVIKASLIFFTSALASFRVRSTP